MLASLGLTAAAGCAALLGFDDVDYGGLADASVDAGGSVAPDVSDGSSGVDVTPDAYGLLLPLGRATIATGETHACAVTNDGRVFCWGSNVNWQLGFDAPDACAGMYGPRPCVTEPQEVPLSVGSPAVELAAGYTSTCARLDDGRVFCWQKSSGTKQVGNLVPVVQIAAAVTTYFGIDDAGTLWAWGSDNQSELGDDCAKLGLGATTPVAIDAGQVVWVRAGSDSFSVCAGTTTGDVLCWGLNNYGQLAAPIPSLDAGTDGQAGHCIAKGVAGVPTPKHLAVDASAGLISLNADNACVVVADGGVKCFGHDLAGTLVGLSEPGPVDVTLPLQDGAPSLATDVAVAPYFACALLTSGAAMCWGDSSGLGRNAVAAHNGPGLVRVDDGGVLTGITELHAGYNFLCARVTGGDAYCWGYNDYGQLGNPDAAQWTASRVNLPP
jgi:alpha-tubulin suppressor-like RCC1 family protein